MEVNGTLSVALITSAFGWILGLGIAWQKIKGLEKQESDLNELSKRMRDVELELARMRAELRKCDHGGD